MKKIYLVLAMILISLNLYAPPNCEVYKEDEVCYKACHLAMKAITYKQGSYQSQKYFDESLSICPSFAYSYMEKAVPYLKRGLFIEWKKLIDKAVEISPKEYLGYRGWCRLQFLRDYEGAINDIEQLQKIYKHDIGYCQTGDYHLNIALALCYKEIGNLKKAKTIFLDHFAHKNFQPELYDYYHIGVLEYELGNFKDAIYYLTKQIEVNDGLGETYYFLALAQKSLGQNDAYFENLNTAETYYRKGKIRKDNYAEMIDKIYLLDILAERESNTD